MRVVIDTNVFVSSFVGGNPRKVIDLWKNGQVTQCLSGEVLDEYTEVLRRFGLPEADLQSLLSLFARGVHILFTSKVPRISVVKSDPDDDKFVACAIALNAEVVITGDRALRAVWQYQGITIVTPEQFLRTGGFPILR